MRSQILALLVLSASLGCAAERPNILFILTDDQGWPTLGCYGGKIVPTPNLDKLAADGARFTDFYVTSQCTPTRASFLTGQYTARHGLWHVLPGYGYPHARMTEPPFAESFPRDTFTLAKGLRAAGYATAIVGKWHLTSNGDGSYMHLNAEAAGHYGFGFATPPLPQSAFSTGGDRGVDRLTDDAIAFIRRNREKPWFCFLSHHMIHGNVVAPVELKRKYRDLGYGDEGPNRAIYLAGLEHIDRSIGRLMEALEEMGEEKDTLVVFTSDNGGIDERFGFKELTDLRPEKTDLDPDLREYDNAPLRMGKGSGYEGGIRVPFIVRWPGKAKPGTVVSTPTHIVDMVPTFFELGGAKAPDGHPLDGRSLVKLMTVGEDEALNERPLFQYYPFYDLRWGLTPSASVRAGRHKLIEFFGDRFDDEGQYHVGQRTELYDVAEDPGESRNLMDSKPEIAKKLRDQLLAWMSDLGAASPVLNDKFDPTMAFVESRKRRRVVSSPAKRTVTLPTKDGPKKTTKRRRVVLPPREE